MAALAKATWRLVPVMVKPSAVGDGPDLDARLGPKPFSGSSQAGVRMASPVTSRGSHSCFCSSLPARASAPPDRMELTKWGEGASDRPNSS